MSNPAAEQLRRLLAFLPQIADGQEHSISEVAHRLGVDVQTITKDLQALSDRFEDPPAWIEKVEIYLQSDRVAFEAASQFRRPMRLTPSEARALELGLSILRAERRPEEQAAVEAALERLRLLVTEPGDGDGQERAASIGTERNLAHVPALRDALRNRRRVAINYQKGSGARPERRTICPFSFAVEKGVWYLVAHCERSAAIRIFRVDRIESVELLSESFERPDDLNVSELLSGRTAFVGSPPETLRVRYSPRVARWIAEREKGVSAEDGSLEVEYPLADPDWAVRHVLQYGPDAEVVAPAEVREKVVERLNKALT